ncbi:cytochrome P450 6AN5 [Danaus plexippus plexippus]|uniref:unspecific monooxygenase n=1 Tax=Danaus plexippus plexippus TaxID=278856 RepID=A0A212FEU1_DANPL|nr:cytochrome P450 6AN5 [Danaus plexippus plexippus]
MTEVTIELCEKFPNEKLIGFYRGVHPLIIVKDRLLMKHICVIDYDHFTLRMITNHEQYKLYTNLFHADGDTFKLLKKALSPAFTTSKLKNMFPLIVKCAEKLQTLGDKIVERGGIVKSDELMSRFTIDFICSCGMGLDFGLFDEKSDHFFEFATSLFHLPTWKAIGIILQHYFTFLSYFTKLQFHSMKKVQIFVDLVKKVCETRNYKPSGRHDFIDLLLEVALNGKLKGESNEKKNPDGSPAPIEFDLSDPYNFAAQVFVFFTGGFETSATTTSFALHQLAMHPDIQRRVQNEIDEVLSKFDNKLCYDAVRRMTLLEMVFLEAMRMFPPGGVLVRVCTKKYTFPGTSTTIEPGVHILIPVAVMHMDETIFENPEKFHPERFSSGYKESTGDMYIPFGVGRRMCIGSSLGHMQSTAGLAAVLQRFNVELAPTATEHVKPDRNIFYIHKAAGGLPIKLVPRILKS